MTNEEDGANKITDAMERQWQKDEESLAPVRRILAQNQEEERGEERRRNATFLFGVGLLFFWGGICVLIGLTNLALIPLAIGVLLFLSGWLLIRRRKRRP